MDDDEFERLWAANKPDDEEPIDPPAPPLPPEEEEPDSPPAKQQPIPLSREDLHNSRYFEFEFGKNVRFDHTTGEWYIWHKGKHNWALDDNDQIHEMAKNAATRRVEDAFASGSSDKLKIAMSLFSRAARQRALDDLRSVPGIGLGRDHWNPNLDLFACANGVIDLRDGAIRPGRQTDEINRSSPVRYEPMADCPRWDTFLREVFVTDDLIEYVRTVVGYCLTGYTTEQMWWLLYGTGGNGKSVFVSTLQSLFGLKQYFESAAGETFIINRWGPSGGHDVDQLKNARLVVASEVPERSMFNSSRIKELTGGDSVTAAAKYKNNATWTPQLKLMMLVNHLPTARDDSPGFWRRIRTIPFEQTFLENPDAGLVDTLRGELPGILNWAVSGAVTWFREGMPVEPATAAALRSEYQAESDPLALFINDCIVETANVADTVAAREMFRVYAAWSASQNHQPMNETNFGRAPMMKALGLGMKRGSQGMAYTGVKVYEPGSHQVSGVTKSD